jgi:hypothetical protein
MTPNPWIILGIVALWIASLGAVGWKANQIGHETEKAAWLAKENKELAAANELIQTLTARVRATEQAHQQRLAAIAANIVKENQNAEARIRRAVAGARALVLRQQPACPSAGASPAGAATPTASGSDGAPACELPATAVRDLFQLVGDADTGMRSLAACQAVILSDRKESASAP